MKSYLCLAAAAATAVCLFSHCTLNAVRSSEPFELIASTAVNMEVTPMGAHHYRIVVSGIDPHVLTSALTEDLPSDAVVLSFEYKSPSSLLYAQVFLAEPITESNSLKSTVIPASDEWRECSLSLKDLIERSEWGDSGDYLRLDFGDAVGYEAEIRNIRFRNMNDTEKEQYLRYKEKTAGYELLAINLREYLSAEYTCEVTHVGAGADGITVSGKTSGNGNFSLCELAPYEDVADAALSRFKTALDSHSFSLSFDRYTMRNGILYDRTLSRWIIVQKKRKADRIVSHARYPDRIEPLQHTVAEIPASKKGIGNVYYADTLMLRDLDDLGITSATINLSLTAFMYSKPGPGRIEHDYGGRKYYFDETYISRIDRTLTICRDKGIVVAGIILIHNAAASADPVIGESMQHPDYVSAGIFTMPNMSNPQSVDVYAAALDFFAARYSRPDKKYGRIHHWIMHNEVDAGFEWTNMGPDKPVELCMDAYVKSMRLCHNIALRYDSHASVMASHTHAWAVPENHHFYPTLDMLNLLNDYCLAEGDFKWGLALHCYPSSLFEPRTWLDQNALYAMDTPLITYKNLEVLDRWIKLPENLYRGVQKRLLWLSENGTNSPSYSAKDQTEQAAGFAWGWKKIAALDGIDAHQWHNWGDQEEEYGLRIGLRKFAKEGREKKEVWYLYQAAGTNMEEAVFNKYLREIGIDDWNIVQPVE